MADQEIKTSIDTLVSYITEHGETNVSAVAGALGVSENVILGWANVLEKAGVIRILHKSGRVFIAPAGSEKGKEIKKEERSHLGVEIESQIEIVNQVSAKIDEFSKSLAHVDTLFNTKYRSVKLLLDKIAKAESYLDNIEKKTNERSKRIKDVSAKARQGFDEAQKYLNQLSTFSVDTNSASSIAQELHTLLKSYEKNAADMSKNLEAVIYQGRHGPRVLGEFSYCDCVSALRHRI